MHVSNHRANLSSLISVLPPPWRRTLVHSREHLKCRIQKQHGRARVWNGADEIPPVAGWSFTCPWVTLKWTYRCDDLQVLQVRSLRRRHFFSNEVRLLCWEPLQIASTLGFSCAFMEEKILQIINHKESYKPVTLACGYAVTHAWMFLSPEALKTTLPCKHKRTRTLCGFLRDFFFCFGALMFLSVYFWSRRYCEVHEEILCRLNVHLNQVSNLTKMTKKLCLIILSFIIRKNT